MLNEKVRKFAKALCCGVALLLVAILILLGIIFIFTKVHNIQTVAPEASEISISAQNWKGFILLIIATAIATYFSFYFSDLEKKQIQKQHKRELTSAERKASELEKLNLATNQELIRAQCSIVSQERWKERAIKCNPEIEHLVFESFARDEADNFKKDFPELETLQACHNNYSVFVKALKAYHKLSDEAKTIVSLDIETLRQKLRDSLTDYINFARNYLTEADSRLEGTPEKLTEITKVINWFENLPVTVKNQIPTTLITSLMMKKANAEYQNALLNGYDGYVEIELELKDPSIFNKLLNWLAHKISNRWGKCKNWCKDWFKKKKNALFNYYTRPLEYEYQDEVLDEDEEEVSIEPTSDDTDENPNYI